MDWILSRHKKLKKVGSGSWVYHCCSGKSGTQDYINGRPVSQTRRNALPVTHMILTIGESINKENSICSFLVANRHRSAKVTPPPVNTITKNKRCYHKLKNLQFARIKLEKVAIIYITEIDRIVRSLSQQEKPRRYNTCSKNVSQNLYKHLGKLVKIKRCVEPPYPTDLLHFE